MKETELAQKFIDFLEGYDIYKEVPANGIVDIVAKDGPVTIAIEVKTSLNFDVIEQAFRNKSWFTFSYIAVPKPKVKHFGYHICDMLGIGVLVYNEYRGWEFGLVQEVVPPKMNRTIKFYKIKLEPYMKDSVAGSQNDRVTAFGNTINNLKNYIRKNPGCTLKSALQNVDFHYTSMSSAKASIYQWLIKGVIKEFYLDKGKLYLNETNQIQ